MFCAVCGQSLQREDNFCIRCGTPSPRERLVPATEAASASAASAGISVGRTVSTTELQQPIVMPRNTAPQLAADVPAEPPEVPAAREALREDVAAPASQDRSASRESWLDGVEEARAPEVVTAAPVTPIVPPRPTPEPEIARAPEYDSVGNEITANETSLELEPADIPTPSFGGYAAPTPRPARQNAAAGKPQAVAVPKINTSRAKVAKRKSRLPVLEIMVAVLLVAGAGAAVWILRSSMPAKSTAVAAPVDVKISPTEAQVAVGKSFDFAAAVSGTNDLRVTWTVQEGDAGGKIETSGAKAENGSVSSMAVYSAPATPGTYHLLATSQADPKRSAEAAITVVKPVNSERRPKTHKK